MDICSNDAATSHHQGGSALTAGNNMPYAAQPHPTQDNEPTVVPPTQRQSQGNGYNFVGDVPMHGAASSPGQGFGEPEHAVRPSHQTQHSVPIGVHGVADDLQNHIPATPVADLSETNMVIRSVAASPPSLRIPQFFTLSLLISPILSMPPGEHLLTTHVKPSDVMAKTTQNSNPPPLNDSRTRNTLHVAPRLDYRPSMIETTSQSPTRLGVTWTTRWR